mgnify:CR=1 FL=1
MKVRKNKRKGNTVFLEVEVEQDGLPGEMDKAFHRLKKDAKVPGFRKGKVSRSAYEKHYGAGNLFREGLMSLISDAYEKAVEEESIRVVDFPQNMDIQPYDEKKPVVFTCEVPVWPEVKLGKYKGVKVTKESADVKDEDIDAQIDQFREKQASYQSVDGPSKSGDIVSCQVEAKLEDGSVYEPWTRENAGFRIGAALHGDEFDAAITGKKLGDAIECTASYPDEFKIEDLAGKKVSFTGSVKAIQEKAMPELNDDFVKGLTEFKDIETVDALKDKLRSEMETQKKQSVEAAFEKAVLEAVTEPATCEIPDVMIEKDLNQSIRMIEERLASSGLNISSYLSMIQKTPEQFKEEMRPDAKTRVLEKVVLSAIQEKEKIEVNDEDMQAEIETWNLGDGTTWESLKKNPQFDITELKTALEYKKTTKFLMEHAKVS